MGGTGHRPLAQHVEGPPGLSEPAHAVVDAPGPQPLLGQHETFALEADEILVGDPHLPVDDLGMATEPAVVLDRILHGGYVTDDVDPRGVGGNDDHRAPLVGVDVGVGHRHHDEEVGHRAVGGEPLVAVDDPLVTVPHRAGGDHGGVGPRTRLGHGEPAAEAAVEQGQQPPLPLLLAARGFDPDGQQLGVSRVGGVVAEGHRPVGGLAQDLVHQAQLDLAESTTAELGRKVRSPQAPALDLLLEGSDGLEHGVVAQPQCLERVELVPYHLAHPGQLLLELGLSGKVPCHGGPPVVLAGRSPGATTVR